MTTEKAFEKIAELYFLKFCDGFDDRRPTIDNDWLEKAIDDFVQDYL